MNQAEPVVVEEYDDQNEQNRRGRSDRKIKSGSQVGGSGVFGTIQKMAGVSLVEDEQQMDNEEEEQ